MKQLPFYLLMIFVFACNKPTTPIQPTEPVAKPIFNAKYTVADSIIVRSSFNGTGNTMVRDTYAHNVVLDIMIDSSTQQLSFRGGVYDWDSAGQVYAKYVPGVTKFKITADSIYYERWQQLPGNSQQTILLVGNK